MAVEAPAASPANPFIGLRRFEIGDSPLFFGRNEQSYELLRRLDLLHFVAVIGPSGCGKSSLVRAGVLAALAQGYLADGGPWKLVMLQPGADPVAEWTRQLTPHLRTGMTADDVLKRPAEALDTSSGKIAILVDQFEELFQFSDRTGRTDEVAAFLRAMLATGAPDAKIYVILTMRSEYLVRCALYPELAEAINEGLYLVPRMTREQMRQAIVAPVKKAGATITVALIDRLLNDASRQEDGLPILQHALMRMWPKRDAFAPLGLDLYSADEGLGAFLDAHAEQVYGELSAEDKPVAEALFRCVTERTPEGRAVRRAQQLDAIATQTGLAAERLLPVIRRFETEGFLITTDASSPLVDISHEAVARQWKRLGVGLWEKRGAGQEWVEGWMIAEARERRAVDRLREAAAEWERNDLDKSYAFVGPQLTRLEQDLGQKRKDVGERERAFLIASTKADRLSRFLSLKTIVPTLAALIAVMGIVAFVLSQRSQANAARTQAATAVANATSADQAATIDRAFQQKRASIAEAEALAAQTLAAEKSSSSRNAPAPTSTPRIYSQVWSDAQEDQLKPALAALRDQHFLTPPVEHIRVGPAANELRYFRNAEADTARKIAELLRGADVVAATKYVPGFEKSDRIGDNHFELWMGRPTEALPPPPANIGVLYLDDSRKDDAYKIAAAVSAISHDYYGVNVMPYKAVTWSFKSPIELHYFHTEDASEAQKLTARLQAVSPYDVQPRFMPVSSEIPFRYFEIWLQGR